MASIIATNDDGIDAPGLLALAEAMRELGPVRVCAPASNQSASGHKITLFQDIAYSRRAVGDGIPALAVKGSPADCIALSLLGLIDERPDIVVSGINRGENMAQDLTYSGTVTAALEAAIHGLPAVAFSLAQANADHLADYRVAAKVALGIAERTLEQGLPPYTILNVNIPPVKRIEDLRGIRLTRQGVRIYRDRLVDVAAGVARVEGEPPMANTDELGTDVWAVHRDYVSVTPVHLDMTAHRFMADLEAWDLRLPSC
ncbi:MAG: 5'/3'-nucleotidase SurE [Chloroflexota bacterium]|nr:5'/3'-nucleotidase SurE [Chloroflexota bacterium]